MAVPTALVRHAIATLPLAGSASTACQQHGCMSAVQQADWVQCVCSASFHEEHTRSPRVSNVKPAFWERLVTGRATPAALAAWQQIGMSK